MKRSVLTLTAIAVAAASALAAPPQKKKKKNRPERPVPVAPAPAVVNPEKPAPDADPNALWHGWTTQAGTKEARYLALENGVLTVETRDQRTLRLPMAALPPAERLWAQGCRELQPRPAFAPDVIARAAGRIDAAVDAALKKAGKSANAPASDTAFLRRVYLTTAGRIPTAAEASAFLTSTAPDKRTALIDQLLDSPGYTMSMFNWLADMLRVKDDYSKGARAWLYEDWLKDQVAMNRPWDVIVRAMLSADGRLSENGAAGFLLRDAQMPLDGVSNLMTTFLGADVSCAQCHDHPLAEWKQKDFYQVAAFFGATDGYQEDMLRKIRNVAKSDTAGLQKGQVQQLLGSNVFDLTDLTGNKLRYPADYKYDNAHPKEKVTPALIHWSASDASNPAWKVDTSDPSRLRDEFAKWMTHPDNPRFATAIANRLWKRLFGVAVKEPVADLDDLSTSASPEVLALLTEYMRKAKFDLREFQRILLNTKTWQRQSAPADMADGSLAGPALARMTAEQTWDSLVALGYGDRTDTILLRRGDVMRYQNLPGKTVTPDVVKDMMRKIREDGVVFPGNAGKKNKGKGKGNVRTLEAAYEGGIPPRQGNLVLARASELPQPASETHFLRLFGQSDRLVPDSSTTDGSVPQVMSLMNGPIQEVAAGSASAAVTTAAAATTPAAQVNSLYLSFLARTPTAAEIERTTAALASGLTLSDLAWVLANTREFLFIR